jgi:hypothetical protein
MAMAALTEFPATLRFSARIDSELNATGDSAILELSPVRPLPSSLPYALGAHSVKAKLCARM